MLGKVADFIENQSLIQKGDFVIAGVSGGADSVCLLFVLNDLKVQFGFSLAAVYVNHGIRAEEAREDGMHVAEICARLDLPFRNFSFDVPALAKEEGVSEEEAGRTCRYQAFEQARQLWNGDKIAVAHHRDDQAETILWNLFRGSGIKGLGGMRPVRDRIIRPLLSVDRREIESYLKEKQIGYRTDSTNLQAIYTRNKIRLELLPYVEKELNQNAAEHIADAGERLREIEDFLETEAERRCKKIVREQPGQAEISIPLLRREPAAIQKEILRKSIYHCWQQLKDISAWHLTLLLKLMEQETGKSVRLAGKLEAVRSYDWLIIRKMEEKVNETQECSIDIVVPGIYQYQDKRLELCLFDNNYQNIPKKAYTKYLDYDTIKGSLKLRTRQGGDYFTVNRQGGKKKLKKFFIDEKIPRQMRDEILLLADGSHVIWIIGYRISEAVKITEQTKRILRIQINGGKEDGA